MLRAHEIAAKAAELVGGDRAKTHGSKLENHENIAALWRGYLRNKARAGGSAADVTALDVANLMELLKVARRQAGAHNPDDYIDGAGYASVAGEIADHCALAEAAAAASRKSFSEIARDFAADLQQARAADAPGEGLAPDRAAATSRSPRRRFAPRRLDGRAVFCYE